MTRILGRPQAWLFAILVAAACPCVAVAAVGPPPSLSGETFSAARTITSVTCFPDQPPFMVGGTFEAHGTATGPYTGTFHETGRASITTNVPGFIYDMSAAFTIDSPIGRVVGTKHSTNFGVGCGPTDDPAAKILSINTADPSGFAGTDTYNSLIRTPTGAFVDSGLFHATLLASPVEDSFDEGFQSSVAAPEQTTKDICKKGGWQKFRFTNQGLCVAFVVSGTPVRTP